MRFLRYLRRMALAAAVLWPLTGAHAQDVFIRVPVELGGTATRMTLPFGEPFLLVGAAPTELNFVTARYLVFRGSAPSRDSCRTVLDSSAPVFNHMAQAWVRDSRLKSDTFSVLVTRNLQANQRYAICLRTQSAFDSTALTKFQARAYAILDSAYAAQNDTTGSLLLPAAQIHTLQQALAKALPLGPGDSADVKGTIFDASDPNVTEKNLVFTDNLLTLQRQRFLSSHQLDTTQNQIRVHLGGLRNDGSLRAIAGTLSPGVWVPGMDASMVVRVAATARMLGYPDPELILAVADGEAVLDPSALVSVKEPAEIAVRAARIDSTYHRLTELRDFAAVLQGSRPLQRRTGVSAREARLLFARLDRVLESLEQHRHASAQWARADAGRRALLVNAARSLSVRASNDVPVIGTSISSFETRAKQFVTADLGVAYAPGMGEVVPYFGASFYLGALNKRVPLSVAKPPELDRWSLTVGVTASSLARKDVRDDLFGSHSLLLGVGRRMADPIRLTGGAVLYRRLDVNPLVDDTHIAVSPFLSLSFDFDAKSALGGLGDTLFH